MEFQHVKLNDGWLTIHLCGTAKSRGPTIQSLCVEYNVMRRILIINILLCLILFLSVYSFAGSQGYSDYSGEPSTLKNKYNKLIETFGSNAKPIGAKWIEMGKKSGKLLFIEYERFDTSPPSRLICAYSQVGPHRYKLMIPEFCLYYGHYRANSEIHFHTLFNDIDSDGEIEILVFSDENFSSTTKPGFYLNTIHNFSEKSGMFVCVHPASFSEFPEEGFNIKEVAARLSMNSYTYTQGYLNYYVDIE